jgi:hypothetical protein
LKLSDRSEWKGSGERYTEIHSRDCAAVKSVCVPFMSADEWYQLNTCKRDWIISVNCSVELKGPLQHGCLSFRIHSRNGFWQVRNSLYKSVRPMRLQTPLSYLQKARKWRTCFTATEFYYNQCRLSRRNAFVWLKVGSYNERLWKQL